MFSLFRAITDRIKALFATSAALELESDLLLHHAERKADLLRRADQYDQEGLHGIATQLRQQADLLSMQRPLASVLPALTHLQTEPTPPPASPELLSVGQGSLPGLEGPPSSQHSPQGKKKGRKS
jgi:hypothetical protein